MTSGTQPPALQSRVLRVGVSGHISLGEADPRKLKESVRGVLQRLRDAVLGMPSDGGPDTGCPPRLVIVSPLAAGSDQLVADEALDLGYELHVPLPFLAPEFERDFEGDDAGLASFRRLLARASRVLELGANRAEKGSAARAEAYETVGWVVLSHSDLLLAIWDGQPAKGRGGTAEVVALALEAGMPVVEITPTMPERPRLCVGGPGAVACDLTLEGVGNVVRGVLTPLAVETAPTPVGASDSHARAALPRQAAAYEVYKGEPAPGGGSLFRRLGSRALLGFWSWFQAYVAGVKRKPRGASQGALPEAPPAHGAVAHDRWASALADAYQGHYRGAFLAMYLLGAVAVSLAVLGLLSEVLRLPHGWGVFFAWVELASLGLIVLVYQRARSGRWHQKGTNYRVLAELLRHQLALAPLGLAAPAPRPRAHLKGEADLGLTWMVAHFRAVARAQGLTAARFDKAQLDDTRRSLAADWLRGQVDYHEGVAAKFHRAAHRMEGWVFWIFFGALVACGLHFLLPHSVGPWLSALAAGLPAWGAAFHGILGSADLPRLADRSHAMAERLRHAAESLEALPPERLTWRSLAEVSRRACADMLGELDDWQALARHRDLRLP